MWKEQGDYYLQSTTRAIITTILFTFLLLAGSAYAAPTISVKYNGADLPGNGYLTMNTPTIDVTITPDPEFELDATTFALILDGTNTGATLNGTASSYVVPSALSEGNHELTITIADVNQQVGTPVAFFFKIDTLNPTLAASIAWSTTTSNTQELTASCTDTASTCTIEYQLGAGEFQPYSTTVPFTATTDTLTVRAKDALEHVSENQIFNLVSDTNAPTFTVTSSVGSNFTKDTTPSISITATDDISGLAKATLQCVGGTLITKTMTGTPLTIEDFDITATGCTTSDGAKDIRVRVQDAAGNNAAEKTLSINYDGQAPSVPTNVDESGATQEDEITLEWDSSSDPSGGSGMDKYYIYRHSSDDFDEADNLGTVQSDDTLEYNNDGLDACKDYYYWVTALDNVGNESGESDVLHVKTTGCPETNDPDTNDNDTSPPSGGGGGTCNVTVTVPTTIYAGETIPVKASGNSYANGLLYAFESGKPSFEIKKTPTTVNAWEGTYTIKSAIGKTITFRFKTDACLSPAITRIVKDPATKTVIPVLTAETNESSDTSIPILDSEPAPKIELVSQDVVLSLDTVSLLLADAGFNAENIEMKDGITSLLNEWKLLKTISVVPGPTEGSYVLRLSLKMENTTNNGTVKIVENIPKSFVESASQLTANYPMVILKDDPLIQFEISGLTQGQILEVHIDGTQEYSIEEANAKAQSIALDATQPPLLFASGTAAAAPGNEQRPLLDITGLASGVGNVAPFVIGLVAFAGIILISVRVVKGSVEGADNPILRSASGIERGGSKTLRTPTQVKGRKIWKKDDAY